MARYTANKTAMGLATAAGGSWTPATATAMSARGGAGALSATAGFTTAAAPVTAGFTTAAAPATAGFTTAAAPAAAAPTPTFDSAMLRLKQLVYGNRIRLRDFLVDFDRLRKGCVHPDNFLRAMAVAGVDRHLTAGELALICANFTVQTTLATASGSGGNGGGGNGGGNGGAVMRYAALLDELDSLFTRKVRSRGVCLRVLLRRAPARRARANLWPVLLLEEATRPHHQQTKQQTNITTGPRARAARGRAARAGRPPRPRALRSKREGPRRRRRGAPRGRVGARRRRVPPPRRARQAAV